jgi:hypothetical protein
MAYTYNKNDGQQQVSTADDDVRTRMSIDDEDKSG